MEQQILEGFVGGNYACTIMDNEDFSETDFRILQNRMVNSLAECRKITYNGQIKLIFMTQDLCNLKDMVSKADSRSLEQLCKNYIESILEIERSGFLDLSCLEQNPEHIWVLPDFRQVRFTYLPLKSRRDGKNRREAENGLRSLLAEMLKGQKREDSVLLFEFLEKLTDAAVTLPELCLCSGQGGEKTEAGTGLCGSKSWRLESLEGGQRILIDKEEFLIGKSVERADGVIRGNPAVSRIHCKIVEENEIYYIEDLESSNGTFVNGCRLCPGERERLRNGMLIKIADVEFQVRGNDGKTNYHNSR